MFTAMISIAMLLVGAAVGACVAYLLAERKGRAALSAAQTDSAVASQQSLSLSGELQRVKQDAAQRLTDLERAAGDRLADADRAAAERIAAFEHAATERLAYAERALAERQATLLNSQQELAGAQAKVADLAARIESRDQQLLEQKALLDTADRRMTEAFATVSRDALDKSNQAFLQLASEKFQTLTTDAAGSLDKRNEQINAQISPLAEMLKVYQARLGEMESQRSNAYASLREQIGTMSQIESELSKRTESLSAALTRPQVRGQWGEITLRKLVELAGLSDRCDFAEQVTFSGSDDEDARRLRPDMVVRLPENRSIVVDCKAVLRAFLEAANAPDEATRERHLRDHSRLIRDRAKDLCSKAYWNQLEGSPEFVVLFLPGESFLYAACQHDAGLIEDLIALRVIPATPTTLIALLKTIEYGWRQQAASENAAEIRKLGTEIYDRLATLAENAHRVGRSLDGAVDAHNKMIGTLETRVLVSARKISELGARGDKEMPDLSPVDRRARELSATLHPEKSPMMPE